MEFLQVFDENKMALDEKIERSLKRTLKDGKYFMIILLFIENENKQFLIQKTSENKGDTFATTGGHVTFNDSSIKTVIKEAKEELGIDLLATDIKYIDTIKSPFCFCDIYYTNKKFDINDMILQDEEVESIHWLDVEKIKSLIAENKFRKSNIEAFNKILEYKKTGL